MHEEGHDPSHWIAEKASPADLVSEIDHRAELKIVELIRHHRPDDAIVAEEGAAHPGTSGVRWIIDPLDGTRNYLIGYPAHAVSIGVEIDGEPVIGVVHDTANDLVYKAMAGAYAEVKNKRLHVKHTSRLDHAIIATGFAPIQAIRSLQGDALRRMLPNIGDIRRSGCPSLDLCSVAIGWVHGFFELGLPEWDYAAGRVIVEAAGGVVRVVKPGKPWPGPVVIAGSEEIVPQLYEELSMAGVPLP